MWLEVTSNPVTYHAEAKNNYYSATVGHFEMICVHNERGSSRLFQNRPFNSIEMHWRTDKLMAGFANANVVCCLWWNLGQRHTLVRNQVASPHRRRLRHMRSSKV